MLLIANQNLKQFDDVSLKELFVKLSVFVCLFVCLFYMFCMWPQTRIANNILRLHL